MTTHEEAWNALWQGIHEIAENFQDDVVFIGGIAVYLHSVAAKMPFTERSHDADLYVSLAAYDDLRSIETVTSNPRLRKKQFIKYGMDYDVYLEHNHSLVIPYADIFARSGIIDGVRVTSLEHLLILKIIAFADRRHTPKGPKDARDIIRIVLLIKHAGVIRHPSLAPYFTTNMARVLEELSRSKEFVTLTRGNLHEARALRDRYSSTAKQISSSALTAAKSPRRRRLR
jgi:hypothetical protein